LLVRRQRRALQRVSLSQLESARVNDTR
jgi:hypothetical protein